MRALEKMYWKGLKAQQNHLKSNDKVSDWQEDDGMKVSGDAGVGPTYYTDSVVFLMKHARSSQKRLSLFKRLRVESSMIHDDCLKAIDTQNPTASQRKKLEKKVREAAANLGNMEEWIGNETEWFSYLDELLSDVIERFTSMYARDELSKDVDFEHPQELESGEYASRPILLTRH